jgi:hypothetical protein
MDDVDEEDEGGGRRGLCTMLVFEELCEELGKCRSFRCPKKFLET